MSQSSSGLSPDPLVFQETNDALKHKISRIQLLYAGGNGAVAQEDIDEVR